MSQQVTTATRPARRAAAASLAGTTIEYYDFFLYGAAAALVFGPQFFPSFSPVAGALASFGVFAAGFLARPLGGLVMGHFGDRVGRKSMLVISLLLVGLTTTAIGLLPTYEQIGVWAPIALTTLRLLQGFGVGGEWSGAVLMSVEHAPAGRRGLFGIFPQTGVPAGLLLSNLAFLAASFASAATFAAWAWRIPFLASIVLVVVGLVVRLRVTESPEFVEVERKGAHSKRPLLDALRQYPGRILVAGALPIASIMITYVFTVYALSYLTTVLKVGQSTALLCVLVGTAVFIVGLPVAGHLCDRIGARRVFLAGSVWLLLSAAVLFPLLNTGVVGLFVVGGVLVCFGLASTYGPCAAMISELFPAHVRFSGSSLGYQLATLLGGAPAPFLAVAVYQATGTSLGVTGYMVALAAVSLVGGLMFSRVRPLGASGTSVADAGAVQRGRSSA
ncbi:MAG: MFS transporter [Streptosporangiales bacterium]|nr:MFS transporter [Streptosporangiales bacterium]